MDLGEDLIGNDNDCLIFSDKIYYNTGLSELVQLAAKKIASATVFSYYVNNPERFGVIEFEEVYALSIEGKPIHPFVVNSRFK